jgi:hypothetical protein
VLNVLRAGYSQCCGSRSGLDPDPAIKRKKMTAEFFFLLQFLVIKTLDQDSEPDPDPYPDPDSLEMLDSDPHMDPDSSGSTYESGFIRIHNTGYSCTYVPYRRKMWYVTYLAPFYSSML